MSLCRSDQQPPGIYISNAIGSTPAVNRTRRKGCEPACGTARPCR